MEKYTNWGYVLSKYLKEHPDEIVEEWTGAEQTLFVYNRVTNKILYRKPKNKVRNNWYESRGTVSVKWFDEKPKRPYIPFLVLDDTEGELSF